jgi:tetratricopeptide (TPR) repeat protein
MPGKLSPQQMDVLRQKVSQAASYYQNGNYDAAINILRDVANQAPDQADVQYALGQACAAKGQTVDAQSALARASSLAPNNQEYKKALFDLNQQLASSPGGKVPESFGVSGNNGSGNVASNPNNGPIGQLTPFTGDNGQPDNQSGWQSASPPTRFYSGNSYFGSGYTPGYMPGYVSGGYSPFGFGGYGGAMGTAAMAGIAGMALGSMLGLMMSHHHRY